MQTDTTASYPPVADVGPLHSALSSLVYSDLMAGVPLPPSFGEEFWSGGKYMEGIPTSITSSHLARTSPFPFGSPKSVVPSTFEGANCTYQGLPFDGSSRWGSSNHELQESSIMNEWMWNEQERLRLNSINPGPSQFSNELSLSLATSHPPPCVVVHGATTIQEQGRGGSELSSSGVTSYSSFHKRHVGSDNMSCSSSSSKALPVSTLLSGPRFFQAMQEILAEVARFALEDHDHHHHRASFASSHAADLESDRRFNNVISCGKELESRKKNLISLLQMVDDQYNHCIDEIHTVISAFHAVTELDPNLHARFALPMVSAMYKSLRERISSHILAMGAQQSDGAPTREDSTFDTSFIQQKWALQQLKKRDNQLWRPQRGLPERSVSVLRAWMFQNFLHPYPKDAEKQLLALKSGLTRSQVSNWFINARVRLWKPMIDEMYAEMNRRKALKNQEDGNNSHRNHMLFESRIF